MNRIFVAAGVLLLTLLTYFQFPGHTYLQSDTQIYAPILEHLWDPTVLQKDILVQRPHVSFTLYDEIALALRRITGLSLKNVLTVEQLVCRGLGIWGIYLMAASAGLPVSPALLVTAIFSLGATIAGPSVLTFEYEPVPRGLAIPLLLLGIGLAANGWNVSAGIAGAAAFVIHPPTALPFWGMYLIVTSRRLYAFVSLFCAATIVLLSAQYQAGTREAQVFFSRLTPSQEELQRLRGSYAWISMWWRDWLPQYVFLFAATVTAVLRFRNTARADLKIFLIGLPLAGVLSIPLSYLLLERTKWALMPQIQPMRTLLFITAFAVFSAAVAACKAVERQRIFEGLAWFALAYLIPINTRVLAIPSWNRMIVLILLAASACLAIWSHVRQSPWSSPAITVTAVAAFFLIPGYGGVKNYPPLHAPELTQLGQWARSSTSRDAVFLFPDAGKELYPGIFRAESLRAVYVDWKGGGQVNFFKELGEEWWSRWQKTMTVPFDSSRWREYRALGIDYVVLLSNHRLPGIAPVFENARFLVYCIQQASQTNNLQGKLLTCPTRKFPDS